MNALLKRTITGLIYAVLFIGSICSVHLMKEGAPALNYFFAAFLLVVLIGCTYEFYKMISVQGASPIKWMGYIFSAGVLVLCVLSCSLFTAAILLAAVICVFFPMLLVVQLWRKSEQPIRDVAYTIVPVFYLSIPLCMMFLTQQLVPDGWLYLLLMVAMVWANDVFAYLGGSLYGKHRMWERVSPKKTWEGTITGILCSVIVTSVLGWWLLPMDSMIVWPAVGLVGAVLATLGDLAESMIKRSVGVKDSGNVMPGHGGFLDRFDSLLAVAPFYFIVIFLVV